MRKIKRAACAATAFALCACCAAGCENAVEKPAETPPEGDKTAYYLRTDKDVYCADEQIFITAGGGKKSWVGIYPESAGLTADGAIIKYSVNSDGMYSGMKYVVDVGENLSRGEYRAVLFEENGVEKVGAEAEFSVVDYAVYTDKDEYFTDEDIVVTAYGGEGAWVGLYRYDEAPTDVTSIFWYYLQKDTHLAGQSYILQRTAKNPAPEFSALEAGRYKLVLFSNDSQTSSIAEKEINVKAGKVGRAKAPVSGACVLDDPSSGTADGVITLEFGKDNGCASEVVAYWANADGELHDYLPFAPYKVYANKIRFNMLDRVFIPEKATKLRFYGKNVNGESEDFLDVPVESTGKDRGKLIYSFNVISDIHITTDNADSIYNKHFAGALRDIAFTDPSSEGMFIVGDIANAGRSEEWKLAQSIIDQSDGAPLPYYTLGNHDLYANSVPYNTKIQDFLKYSGQEKAYYEVTIKGVHHLILGSQAQVDGGVDCLLMDDQLEWLESRLEEITAEDPSAPVFLYNHQSVYRTIAGSLKGQLWNGMRPNDRVKEILGKYPQVLFFNGHSHWVMQSYRNAYPASNEMPNVFNTSSVAYLWSTTDREIEVAGSEGYFVSIYKDRVYIYGRDFVSRKWIPSACYIIENKV